MEIVLSHHHTIAAILAQLPKVSERARLAVVCRAWAAAVRESAEIWRDLHPAKKGLRLATLCGSSDLTAVRRAATLLDVPRDLRTLDDACRAGKLDIAEWLTDRYDFTADDLAWTTNPLEIPLLTEMCGTERLDVIQWIITRFAITKEQLIASECLQGATNLEGFTERGLEDHIPALEWVIDHYRLTRENLAQWGNVAFTGACYHNKIELLRWLVAHQMVPTGVDILRWMGDACWKGHIDVARLLTVTFNITPTMMDLWYAIPFRSACGAGRLETVQWLVEKFSISRTHVVHQSGGRLSAMSYACSAGCLPLVQWLVAHYDIHTEDLLADNNCRPLFNAARGSYCNDLTRWLLTHFDLRSKRAMVKFEAQQRYDLAMAKWVDEN